MNFLIFCLFFFFFFFSFLNGIDYEFVSPVFIDMVPLQNKQNWCENIEDFFLEEFTSLCTPRGKFSNFVLTASLFRYRNHEQECNGKSMIFPSHRFLRILHFSNIICNAKDLPIDLNDSPIRHSFELILDFQITENIYTYIYIHTYIYSIFTLP